MTPLRLVYEPCAGGAAFTLALLGGPRMEPPVAWMGSKRRLARHMLAMVGARPGEGAEAVVLADPGPWGWVWPVLLQEDTRAAVVATLRSWRGRDPRTLWNDLAAQPPPEDLAHRAAHWLWLQARAAGAVPVWWESSTRTYRIHDHHSGGTVRAGQTGLERRPERLLASDGRGDPRPAGQRGDGVLVQGSGGARRKTPQPAGQRNTDGPLGRCKGIMDPGTVAGRLDALAEHVARWRLATARASVSLTGFGADTIAIHHGPAEDLVLDGDHRGTVVLFDPPYQGRTGYGWDMPRAQVLELARAYADAGAWVLLCEAVPLDGDLGPGWEAHDLTSLCRRGSGPEWVTTSRPARARVAVQALLPWAAA